MIDKVKKGLVNSSSNGKLLSSDYNSTKVIIGGILND